MKPSSPSFNTWQSTHNKFFSPRLTKLTAFGNRRSQHKQWEKARTGHLLNSRELAGAGAPWQKIPPEDAQLQQRANQEFTVVIN